MLCSENLIQFLDLLKSDFGTKFILDMFRHKVKFDNYILNLLLCVAQNGGNLPELLKWMRVNFTDFGFLEEQIFSVTEIDKRGILYNAFWKLPNQILTNLLDEIRNWDSILGNGLFRRLILMEDTDQQHFFYAYSGNDDFDTDFFIEILDQLKIDLKDSFLSKFIFHVDRSKQTFLNYFCILSKDFDLLQFLRWFQTSFGHDNLKKLLLLRDVREQSILFHYFSKDRNLNPSDLEILSFPNFDENFRKIEIILQKTKFGENVLQLIFLRSRNFEEFGDFVKHNLKITDAELSSSLTGSGTSYFGNSSPILYFHIAQRSAEDQQKYINYMKHKFGENILDESSIYIISLQCHRFSNFPAKFSKFLDFIERNFPISMLKKSIQFEGFNRQTFLFNLYCSVDDCLIKIFNILLEIFKNENDILKAFLLSVDKDGNSFLIFEFSQCFVLRTIKVSKELFELVKTNFGVDFLKQLLLVKNEQGKNFHHTLLFNEYGGLENSLQVLEILLEVVGKDEEFFRELTNQEQVPKEIKEFLETNLEI
jgi:hypothetical protein